jgi:hypothetical protein
MSMQMVKRAGCMENFKLLGETQPGPKCPEQELVELTQVHPLFQHLYNFPSYHEGWKILKRAKEASNPERLVSLGCELVQCARHHTEVVHICAVNCDCKLGSRIVI